MQHWIILINFFFFQIPMRLMFHLTQTSGDSRWTESKPSCVAWFRSINNTFVVLLHHSFIHSNFQFQHNTQLLWRRFQGTVPLLLFSFVAFPFQQECYTHSLNSTAKIKTNKISFPHSINCSIRILNHLSSNLAKF
jgi:hypothetical protein